MPAASDARKLSEEVSRAAEEYLTACISPGPAVLIVDDVQWFDDSTRELVRRLTASASTPLLVVMTGRPEASAPTAAEVIEVGPLSASDSDALLEELGTRVLDDDARAALLARGDGVPLYLEELARAATEAPDAEPWPGDEPGRAPPSLPGHPESTVPNVLYELLVALLYATPGIAPVAAAAATIGRDVDHALLAEVMDVSETDLAPAIETLLEERVLEQDTATRSRFRHELLRDVAYELQPPSQRRRLHARVGNALVRKHLGNDVVDWALVANHFERAGKRAAAADAFEHSADEARRRGALDEARSHLAKAIESIEGLPSGAARDRREVRAAPPAGLPRRVHGGQREHQRGHGLRALPEPRRDRRRRRGDVPDAHRRLGVLRRPGRARPRPPGPHHPPTGADRCARLLDAVQHRRLRHARLVRRELRSGGGAARGGRVGGPPRRP